MFMVRFVAISALLFPTLLSPQVNVLATQFKKSKTLAEKMTNADALLLYSRKQSLAYEANHTWGRKPATIAATENLIRRQTKQCSVTRSSTIAAGRIEKRCGWFVHRVQASVWLMDKDGKWTIVRGGQHSAKLINFNRNFGPNQWIETRPDTGYGYGCACLQVVVDRQTHRVLEVHRLQEQSIAICRKDPNLPAAP